MKEIIYTADDEEPKCGMCEHFADNFDCIGSCGSEHAWYGYERVEIVEESEETDNEQRNIFAKNFNKDTEKVRDN